ncbi:MAG TPA: radical SAM protein, partial [Candidatus Bathyarchaeia archaeon]|nr:radical SAM protein [Candidatus Bathyarchaeia archaeon]
ASRPDAVARLCDAGLDSIRVSLNSTQTVFYERYYCPRDYDFSDVLASIRRAQRKGIFVSLNYLTVPGFTDSIQEFQSLKKFLDHHAVSMIQWRNLNFDPHGYFHRLKYEPGAGDLIGIGRVIHDIHRQYPSLIKGYFNPSRARMRRHQNS